MFLRFREWVWGRRVYLATFATPYSVLTLTTETSGEAVEFIEAAKAQFRGSQYNITGTIIPQWEGEGWLRNFLKRIVL